MRRILRYFWFLAVMLFLPIVTLAQSGPGGVSNDNDPLQNCRLWLDAGDLSYLGDGSYVHVWKDKSNSAYVDTAIWLDGFQEKFDAPLFRSNPAYSINGKPVISFEGGGMLLMGRNPNDKTQNPDLSADGTSQPAPKRTVFVAFRTGNDITARQYLWEQGGGWKGMGIFISNSYLYIGVYNLPSGDGLTPFGYCYKKAQVQPNTTYVVSMVLDAPTDGSLNTSVTSNNALRGTINGGNFGNLEQGASKSSLSSNGFGVGAIGPQGDPIGIGGVNSLAADEISINDWSSAGNPCVGFTPCNNTLLKADSGLTGQFTFKGRIAELCYYAYSLNDAERIIVENYLAAKYFANVIDNDIYDYQANYGNDVIGIGAQINGDEHNHSKGDNLFEISVADMDQAFKFTPGSRYLLVGHNGNPLQWTNQSTPDTATVQRLRRTWRFDRSGFTPGGGVNVIIKIKASDLPAFPGAGYKPAVLIDDSNGPLPNFSSTSRLIELVPNGQFYTGQYLIPDGAYFTIAAVRPTIQFKKNSDFTLETDDPNPTVASVSVELNYSPMQGSIIHTGVFFVSGTASNPADYTTPNSEITITPPSRTGTISFNIINDTEVDIPPVKDFLIILDPLATDNGFFIGKRDTLIYKIYDDDPDPKATFVTATNDTITESGIGGSGLAQVDIRINGTTNNSMDRKVRVINDPEDQTATYGVDYTLPTASGWSNLPPPDGRRYKDIEIPEGSGSIGSVQFEVFTDNIHEDDESINFILESQSEDVGTDVNSIIQHTINLVDINPEPEVEFLAGASEGFEGVSQPQIVVTLSGPSAKTIQVPFAIEGGTATNGAYFSSGDYAADSLGTLIFPPGDTLSYLYYYPGNNAVTLSVYADSDPEPDETIEFALRTPVTNAQLGSGIHHTYTIKDYQSFEWEGAAGVGKARDNIFWIDLDNAVTGLSGSVPQRSPRPINILQPTANNRPTVTIGRNNQNVMDFDGSSSFYIVSGNKDGKSPFINTAGFYDSKDIFFVVTPQGSSSNIPKVIFEEGGMDTGLNIYLKNNQIFFQVWNATNNDGIGTLAPWGGNNSYVSSNVLSSGDTFVVSCHYDRENANPLRIYVNGELEDAYGSNQTTNPNYVGRLYVHEGKIAIGGVYYDTRFDDGPRSATSGFYFNGQIGEMIYYNNRGEEMNTARIRIVHNYLSARFNVPLVPSAQVFDLTYANQTNSQPTYNKDVAGIGIMEPGNVHGVAQGPSQMKVSGSGLSGTDRFILWGHNNQPLTNTWPFSYGNATLPAPVQERSGRVWRFSENFSGSSNLQIEMNFSESANAAYLTSHRELLRLLVSDNPTDWSNAAVFNPSPTQPNESEGARVVFDNVSISDGSYVALGNTSLISVAPLPIELINFSARFESDYVNISWTTASEANNEYFKIERAGPDLKWKEIAQVAGAGNSNSTLYYNTKDRKPLSGISYYRLKQVDFDGKYKYSDVVSVMNPNTDSSEEIYLFPNPSKSGMVYLRLPAVFAIADVKVRIFNISGVKVREAILNEGAALRQLTYGDLAPGIYFVNVQLPYLDETKKLVIQ